MSENELVRAVRLKRLQSIGRHTLDDLQPLRAEANALGERAAHLSLWLARAKEEMKEWSEEHPRRPEAAQKILQVERQMHALESALEDRQLAQEAIHRADLESLGGAREKTLPDGRVVTISARPIFGRSDVWTPRDLVTLGAVLAAFPGAELCAGPPPQPPARPRSSRVEIPGAADTRSALRRGL